ncbi:DUF2550 domain-containing protein [Pseudonocardia xinjiangensis]|uniref:DUF2550 domain-containing protein n=1 Tax=Pseudonocardia xinjiangensis TaxID=75289 RepID=UPI003D9501C7
MALVVGILLLIACLGLGYLAFRRVRLMRGGGVDVFLRRRPAVDSQKKDDSAGWHFGVGRYRGNELAWFRLTSFRLGPTAVVDRTQLEIVDRRSPSGGEIYLLPPTASVLRCRVQGEDVEIAMGPGVLTGFLSWLEATPPGRTGYRQAS